MENNQKVGIIMGSDSDIEILIETAKVMERLSKNLAKI